MSVTIVPFDIFSERNKVYAEADHQGFLHVDLLLYSTNPNHYMVCLSSIN